MHATSQPRATRRRALLSLGALAAAALAACGSNDESPPEPVVLSGVVADGPLQGATACYDLDASGTCGAEEPRGTSDADGRFALSVEAAAAGLHAIVVEVPATAIDKDTGAAVGTAFTLKAPPTGTSGAHEVFVSPLTALVVDVAADRGLGRAEAEAAVQSQLGLANSPMANYVSRADAQAATLARTVNAVIVEIQKLAEAASVPADATRALVGSVLSADLATLATLAASAAGTSMIERAAQVAAPLLAERNLNAASVAEQAELAKSAMAVPPATPPGPFFAVRRFTYTDAGNHQLQAFVGNSTPGSDGTYPAHEVRVSRVAGADQAFNRNTAYWVPAAPAAGSGAGAGSWQVCANAYGVLKVTPQTDRTPQTAVFCGASVSQIRSVDTDVSGRRMADVVGEVRASSLRDAPGYETDPSGLPTRWGPEPAVLGDAVFPEGARWSWRMQINEVGDTERYSLVDKPRVAPDFRHAATLTDLRRMSGDLVDATVKVSNVNTIFLDDLPNPNPAAGLSAVTRYRAGFDPGSDRVRFYRCEVLASNNTSRNCLAIGDGTSAIAVQADSRVMRFAAGYPAALGLELKRQRLFVERSGVVFGGNRDLQRSLVQQRPNTVAWNALRTALGMAEPAAPQPPAGPGPFSMLRSFAFTDAANFSARTYRGDASLLDTEGYYAITDIRESRSAGVDVPFQRHRLHWTGSEWFDCPADAAGAFRANPKPPFESQYCKGYQDERVNSATVTLDGRSMADVVRDIRWYPTPDGGFNHAGWGPNPDVHTQLAAATFPAGSTMEYRGNLRKATPITIATNASGDKVRVPPANPSAPFANWPFAASLEEFIAKYPGDLKGGPLDGSSTFWVWGQTLAAPPAPEYTNTMQYRVAFDPDGQKARIWRSNISAATGFTANYVKLLDTTYMVQTLGDAKVLTFAAMPDGFERDFRFQRLFAEREGAVWYAYKDTVSDMPEYSIRLNGVATEALRRVLGIQ